MRRTSLTNSPLSPFFLQGFRGFTEPIQAFGRHLIRKTIVLPWPTLLPLAFTRFAFPSRAKNIIGREHLKGTLLFPHFSYKVIEILPRLVKGLDAISCGENINFLLLNYLYYCVTSVQVFIIHPGGENHGQPLNRRFLPQQSTFISVFPAYQITSVFASVYISPPTPATACIYFYLGLSSSTIAKALNFGRKHTKPIFAWVEPAVSMVELFI